MRILPVSFLLLSLAVSLRVAAQDTPAASVATDPVAAIVSQARSIPPAKKAAKTPTKSATKADRLDLETTVVTGNHELPKVLYIVPWKKADLGELPAQPFNTLLDEVLAPVDRDVFKREVKYFHAATDGATTGGTAAKPASVPSP
jgi:hypothetical protein